MHPLPRTALARVPAPHGRFAQGFVALGWLVLWLAAGGSCQSQSPTPAVSPAVAVSPGPGPGRSADAGPDATERAGDGRGSDAGTTTDALACHEAVCCVGPQCPKRAPGIPCQSAEQCETGFCADGVCCNVACGGACVACNEPDRMGECLPVAAGAPDPHLLCRHDPAVTCGQSGVCNGEGGCAKHNAGVPCSEPRCDDPNTMMPASECDGEGACVTGAAVACLPFLCEGQGCRVTCTDDRQCLAPRICINGSCGKRGQGQTCTASEQCESGFCVDGVCCESACQDRCFTCSSSKARGKCQLVAAGTPDPRAQGAAPGSSPGAICLDQGATSCGSNGRCDGKGGCELYRNGTTCAPGRCELGGATAVSSSVCRAGKCEAPAPQACAPFRGCDGNRCSTRCSDDKDCVDGMVCTAGSCGKRPIGSVCSRNDECAGAGVCAQGRCCATSCDKPCMACNLEGWFGSCQPVPMGGADPSNSCQDDVCSNGCDGSGSCRRERAGTVCAATACAAGNAVTTPTCTAQGICQKATAPCPEGQSCRDGHCGPINQKAPGETCSAGGDCASGACVAGRCCSGSCTGSCRTCSAQTDWKCVDRLDDTPCESKQICRTGRCVVPCTMGRSFCGSTCVDLLADPDNCGSCARKCDSRSCEKGVCTAPVAACPAKQLRCGGSCVDPGTNTKHCGGCDRPCATGSPICALGKCTSQASPPPSKPDAKPEARPDAAAPK